MILITHEGGLLIYDDPIDLSTVPKCLEVDDKQLSTSIYEEERSLGDKPFCVYRGGKPARFEYWRLMLVAGGDYTPCYLELP